MKQNVFKIIKEYLLLTLGTAIVSVGVYFLKIPNGFSTGGVTGIATIIAPFTAISAATWITILNMSLLVLGFIFLGKSTGAKTVYCSMLLSFMTQAFEYFLPLKKPLTDEPFLELVYAMLLTSIGAAILFHYKGSSGGTDILALILKKYTSINEGRALLYVDAVVAVSSIFVFGIKIGLFSILGLFAKAFLVDGVIESIDTCKYFTIITTKPDEINKYILEKLNHSATIVSAVGAYTNDDKTMIHTVVRRSEAIRLQANVKKIDPNAFTIITTSSEIIGHNFKSV